MNFPNHTESVPQPVDHFKQEKYFLKVLEKTSFFPKGGGKGGTS